MADDPLALDPEQMRRMGFAVVELLVRRMASLADEPVLRTASRAEMEARIDEPAPAAGRDFAGLLDRLDRDVLPFVGHFDHPRFFGYIPGAGTWPAALGDLIAAATNIDSGAWRESAGPSELELTVPGLVPRLDRLSGRGGGRPRVRRLGRQPDRDRLRPRGDRRSDVAADRRLCQRPDPFVAGPRRASSRLPAGPDPRPADRRAVPDPPRRPCRRHRRRQRCRPDPVPRERQRRNDEHGAVDDLVAIARLCRERGIWLHVDGAYGAFAVLSERGRAALAGLELADSVTLDPHKWLAMPFEVGCLMVRDGAHLERAFELHPEYLQERTGDHATVNFADRGLQLTRASRAIKVWLAIQTFGVDAFRAAIDRAIDLTLAAQARIESDERLELITPASLGVLTFRRRGRPGRQRRRRRPGERTDRRPAGRRRRCPPDLDGHRRPLRDPAVRPEPLERAGRRRARARAGRDSERGARSGAGPVPGPERASVQAGVAIDWLTGHDLAPDELRGIASFAAVTDEQAGRFLATGREEACAMGDTVTERWALARTFYIVRAGSLSVRIGDREVNTLRPGDHLGEISAIDWGRDFSYGRTATVVATETTRLLAFPAAALRDLMLDNPAVDRAIRRIAQARLGSR